MSQYYIAVAYGKGPTTPPRTIGNTVRRSIRGLDTQLREERKKAKEGRIVDISRPTARRTLFSDTAAHL